MSTRDRGKKSNDDKDFALRWHPTFKEAVDDCCYLLTRGYGSNSTLQIVGNRYRLNKRQRDAISRIGASDQDIQTRTKSCIDQTQLRGQSLAIDGFNLLIILESALSGAYIFKGRDGTIRDISSVHGSYKRVQKTNDALQIIGKTLIQLGVNKVHWYFDQPVSNSGKLKTQLRELAEQENYPWEISLDHNPDKVLAASQEIVISSDAWILNECQQWFNLCGYVVENCIEEVNIVSAI